MLFLHYLAVVGAFVALIAAPVDASLIARAVPVKPARTVVGRGVASDRVVVKFAEGTRVRLGARGFEAPAHDLSVLADVLGSLGIEAGAIRRLFRRPVAALDVERDAGERRGARALADLNLYYEIALPPGREVGEVADALNALAVVELAMPVPLPAPPPVDLDPPTPDFTIGQGHLASAPAGIGADDVGGVPGADGTAITVVDAEFSWILDHEDLELPSSASVGDLIGVDPFPPVGEHGTAVLGVLGARRNGYGVGGIVPAASFRVSPVYTNELGYDLGHAVSVATGLLRPGDVILLEQQIGVCALCDNTAAAGCGPVEYYPPWFDAIAAATALGITVVEAAGNGNVDLDGPACGGIFNRGRADSGAIMVGAGAPFDHSRLDFSSYGSRVDVQGWGIFVTTAGYGDLFDPGDLRQRYTYSFSGTSSASAIVAGAVVAMQGARIAAGQPPFAPRALRARLRATGTPQTFGPFAPTGAIGPLPNLARAILCGNGAFDPGESCDDGNIKARDGCSPTCAVESCASCAGEPSVCVPPGKACTRCARAVAAEGARAAVARVAALARCESAKVAGRLPAAADCAGEETTARTIAKAEARMTAKITAACGGADKICGTFDRDEVAPSVLAWPATCPDLDSHGCTNPVGDCAGLIACLACTERAAADHTSMQAAGALLPSDPRLERRLNKCQRAIAEAAAANFGGRSLALQRCWDGRARQRHEDDCATQSGLGAEARAAALRIERLRTKLARKVCKACGGPDGLCDGVDDLSSSAIGFAPFCEPVRTPGGTPCARAVTSIGDVVGCVDCVAEHDAACVDAMRVPAFTSYPPECNTPPLGPCCEAHATAGCEQDACSACVCGRDPFCCTVSWDGQCVHQADLKCGIHCRCR